MARFFIRTGLLGGLLALASGCGQEDPAPPSGTGGTTEPGTLAPYHPLVPGSWWEYAHSDWTERVELSATTFDGQPAFLMSDSPGDDHLRSDAILQSIEGRIARMKKDELFVAPDATETLQSSATYGVGFTRFNENWANQAVGFKDTPSYERIETHPGEAPRPAEARRHTFEVVSLSTPVTTGKGNFDCIQIQRTKDWQVDDGGVDASDAQTKMYWFARGVGKVQERNEETLNTEVLIDYFIPDGG